MSYYMYSDDEQEVQMKLEKLRDALTKDTVGRYRGRLRFYLEYLENYDKNIETIEELLSYPNWEKEFLRYPAGTVGGLKAFKKLLTEKGYSV